MLVGKRFGKGRSGVVWRGMAWHGEGGCGVRMDGVERWVGLVGGGRELDRRRWGVGENGGCVVLDWMVGWVDVARRSEARRGGWVLRC